MKCPVCEYAAARPFEAAGGSGYWRFDTLLKPGGWLGLMTGMLSAGIDFDSWHYRRDPTHVVFYQRATLRHLADRCGWRCEFPARDVALMRKPDILPLPAGP